MKLLPDRKYINRKTSRPLIIESVEAGEVYYYYTDKPYASRQNPDWWCLKNFIKSQTELCEWCGEDFTPTDAKQVYCEKQCQADYSMAKKLKGPPKCETCGKHFQRKASYAKTCENCVTEKTLKSRQYYHRDRSKEYLPEEQKRPVTRKCLKCGETFKEEYNRLEWAPDKPMFASCEYVGKNCKKARHITVPTFGEELGYIAGAKANFSF